ncbi:uncharacterized protein JCM10292_000612 [Rhodotorula paludigena]|uniref:uncharacterized protein n=1 Tax=Rhodotorula paludigena TaxID=86838 RepID=UPI003172F357
MSHLLDKAKHALHLDDKTKDPAQLENEKHGAMLAHNREEARADALIAERESVEEAHPTPVGVAEVPVAGTGESGAGLSSMPQRPALEDAAEGHTRVEPGEVTLPDLDGVTHVPERELPPRKERMENTATRPADAGDPESMNGYPVPLNVAGDDRML